VNRVKGKSLKWLSLILLLVFSLTIVNVTSAPPSDSVDVFVNPPEIRDDTLQAGSNFAVGINVFNVIDLYGWQVNMSWDPSIISATTITEGVFLKGPFPWDSHPYDDVTEPFGEQTKTPTTNVTIISGWTTDPYYDPPFPSPTLVECVEVAGDHEYAVSDIDSAEEELGDFGFITGGMSCVAQLQVGVLSRTTETNTAEQDKIEIEVSNDGGTSWGPTHTINVYPTALMWWEDVTDDFSWVPSMLTDANFKVRMTYRQVGENAIKISVDYFAVEAVDTLIVGNPVTAYDKSFVTYASFSYSDIRGNFTVIDLSHDFPSGATNPLDETSTIVQVDFNMKYQADASSLGDRYKIAYYVDPSSTETVLEDWKSTGTSLGNYTWPDQSEPNGLGWNWLDVSNIRIVVETDRVGGDPNAVFMEYEAWVTVHYIRPTTMDTRIEEGWTAFSVLSKGKLPGVDGNGLLATVEFEVLEYGDTILNITHSTGTILWDSSTPPSPIPFTPENGYFDNTLAGDCDKDSGHDVDYDDFTILAGAYGSKRGDPGYDERADFDNDDDVDYDDFIVLAGNYGRSLP